MCEVAIQIPIGSMIGFHTMMYHTFSPNATDLSWTTVFTFSSRITKSFYVLSTVNILVHRNLKHLFKLGWIKTALYLLSRYRCSRLRSLLSLVLCKNSSTLRSYGWKRSKFNKRKHGYYVRIYYTMNIMKEFYSKTNSWTCYILTEIKIMVLLLLFFLLFPIFCYWLMQSRNMDPIEL